MGRRLDGLFRKAAAASPFVERNILSVAYLFLGVNEFRLGLRSWAAGWTGSAVLHGNLFLLQSLIGVMLLFGEVPTAAPQTPAELLVPVASLSFFLVYDAMPGFPAVLRRSLLPMLPRGPVLGLVLALDILGPALCLWGTLCLGRSFGLFVSVRTIVSSGPYRWVRHPIYLGYFCLWAGMVLVEPSPAMVTIVAAQVALFVHRARLEESRLAASSPEYRASMAGTGFLFPKF